MQYSSEKEDFSCMSGDARNVGSILMVQRCDDFWMRWDSFAFIDRTKEFGKFIWSDNKKELINIFRYSRKVPCKCMKSAMLRHEAHVQKAKFSVKILSTLENA